MKLRNNKSLGDTLLRFPLTAMVVLRHCRLAEIKVQDTNIASTPDGHHRFTYLFPDALTSLAVPTFFVMFGYLFFYKFDSFGRDTYVGKLKNILSYKAFFEKTFPQGFRLITDGR